MADGCITFAGFQLLRNDIPPAPVATSVPSLAIDMQLGLERRPSSLCSQDKMAVGVIACLLIQALARRVPYGWVSLLPTSKSKGHGPYDFGSLLPPQKVTLVTDIPALSSLLVSSLFFLGRLPFHIVLSS